MRNTVSIDQAPQLQQQKRLHDLLSFVLANSAFYREFYRNHGITENNLRTVKITDLPLISKRLLMDHFDDAVTDSRLRKSALESWIRNNLDPRQPFHSDFIAVHSSGSSGQTGIFVYDRIAWQIMMSRMAQHLPSPEAFPKKTRVAFCIAAYSNFTGVTTALELSPVFEVLIVSVYESRERTIRLLNKFQPHRIIGYPESVGDLAKMTLAGELNIRPATVFLSGTRPKPVLVNNVSNAWSPQIFELYMASESIFLGARKIPGPGLVMLDDLNIVEILDDKDRAVPPGGYGRVVLTNLYNHALPIIRYELRDYAIRGEPDPGSGFSTVVQCLGRDDDLLPVVSRDGVAGHLQPGALLAFTREEFESIQFISLSQTQIRIEYVADQPLDQMIATAFKSLLEQQNGEGTTFEVRRVEDIVPDPETGKVRLVRVVGTRMGQTSQAVVNRFKFYDQPQLLFSLDRPFEPFPREALQYSIPERFASIRQKYSQHAAVKNGRSSVTYEQLESESDRIARALQSETSAASPAVVGICLNKDFELIAGILAVLKSGLAYTCFDPSSPVPENLTRVLIDAQPDLILTNSAHLHFVQQFTGGRCRILNIDDISSKLTGSSTFNRPGTSGDIAYLLYSSGSTGVPKGIVHTHESALHACMMNTNDFHISSQDRIGFLNSITFNPAVRDIFSAILNGACLFPFDLQVRGFEDIPKWLAEEEITVLSTVPTLFREIVKRIGTRTFPRLRLIELVGEIADSNDLELYRRHFSDRCVLVNTLGSSECHVLRRFMIRHETNISTHRLPCGLPVVDKDISLIDPNGEELGFNRAGEIVVESRYLASGYWRRPDLTRQKFLPPVENSPSHHKFLTGDIGVILENGLLYHLGRSDSQMKIRGLIVDREEVQRAIREISQIGEVIVSATRDASGREILAAYYTVTTPPGPAPQEIRKRLTDILPEHMIPSAYFPVTAIPKTESGKLDLQAFAASNSAAIPAVPAAPLELPRSLIEQELAAIWKEVLDVKEIGIHQNFLDVGGHSLSAMQIVSRISERFGFEVSLRDLFDTATIASVAGLIEANLAVSYSGNSLSDENS